MGPVQAFQTVVFEKYADFSGRANRSEYWYYTLATFLLYVVIFVVGALSSALFLAAVFVVGLGLIVPSLAVAIRRLHDRNQSGWWFLISFVPFGGIVFLIFMVLPGDAEANRYGPPPT